MDSSSENVRLPLGNKNMEQELTFNGDMPLPPKSPAQDGAQPEEPRSRFLTGFSGKGLVSLSDGKAQPARTIPLPPPSASKEAQGAKEPSAQAKEKEGKTGKGRSGKNASKNGNNPPAPEPAPVPLPVPAPLPSAVDSSSSGSSKASSRKGNFKGGKKKGGRNAEMDLPDFDIDDIQISFDDSELEQIRPLLDKFHLRDVDITLLSSMAETLGITKLKKCERNELIDEIVEANAVRDCRKEIKYGSGVFELAQAGCGFLRSPEFSYLPCQDDIYISPAQIKRYALRPGDTLVGQIAQPRDNELVFAMTKVESINGILLEQRKVNKPFEKLVPYYATQRILLENGREEMTMRVIDLFAPIGRGQRGLIVAQPRTGKTMVLQKIANSILANNDDVTLIVLLIDERPEEVTDMKRIVDAEIVSSTFDEPADRHIAVSEMVLEKAKRLVEEGRHVVILLDSITRLARAYNTAEPHSGRILSGGVDSNALHRPKRFFGAARNIEGGGSLTILATALIDTGSRMDELIFEEFKGTGNMELHLERTLSDRRIFPAINVEKSGTRREELFVHPQELERMWDLRKAIVGQKDMAEGMLKLLAKLRETSTNIEFLLNLKKVEKEKDEEY